jgi:ribosome-binding protein aMBF1 (putative translation factor)
MRADAAIGAGLIRQARRRVGLSQAQLAQRSGKAKVQIGLVNTNAVGRTE